MRIASSPASSLSTRQMLSVLPDSRGLRTRVSLSSVSKNFRASKLRRGVICEAQDSTTGIPLVTDSTFESLVLKVEETIFVDFWAPWCGPCKMIDPVVNELAQQYAEKMKFLQTKHR